MYVLVVDDLRLFGDKFVDLDIRYALNSKDAITILEQEADSFEEIWLDHDLGIVDEKIDDVIPVVNWIEEKLVTSDKLSNLQRIRILTSNPVGYQKIKALGRYIDIGGTPQHIGVRNVD